MAGRRRPKPTASALDSTEHSASDVPVVAGGEFPAVELPVKPGYAPMEALATTVLPGGEGCTYAELESVGDPAALTRLGRRAG
jgi:hypothetical protein